MIFLRFVIGLKYLDFPRVVLALYPQHVDMGLMIFSGVFKANESIARCTAMSQAFQVMSMLW